MTNEELVKKYQEGNKDALNELIENNTGIIKKIANKYPIKPPNEYDDYFQSGVVGFMEAVKRYDLNNPNKAKFITYAVHYINRYILDSVNGHSVKERENNKLYNSMTSLNTPVTLDSGDNIQVVDLVAVDEEGYNKIDEDLYRKQLRKDLEKAMEKLTLRERDVIRILYKWNGLYMTIEELGGIYGVTREAIRQSKANGLNKLRRNKVLINAYYPGTISHSTEIRALKNIEREELYKKIQREKEEYFNKMFPPSERAKRLGLV